MTAYTVAAGGIAAHGKTLTAATVDTVTFTDPDGHPNARGPLLTIVSDGAAALFYTLDGTTPTVNGANCYMLPAGAVSRDTRQSPAGTDTVVKLISAGTPTYSVQKEG